MKSPTTLWRFPGPIALAAALDGEPATLHRADADVVYLGDETLWDWPGVAEFGALTVFQADRLDPVLDRFEGWYVVKNTARNAAGDWLLAPTRVLYVPDLQCARAVAGAKDAVAGRAALPAHYEASVAERRASMAEYAGLLDQWGAARARLPDPSAVEGANAPLYMRPAAERPGIIARLTDYNEATHE